MDDKRFEADMRSDACKKHVEADMTDPAAFRVNATPTFYVNGSMRSGTMPTDAWKKLIDDKLAIVAASKVPAATYYQKEVMSKGEKKFRSKRDPKPRP